MMAIKDALQRNEASRAIMGKQHTDCPTPDNSLIYGYEAQMQQLQHEKALKG